MRVNETNNRERSISRRFRDAVLALLVGVTAVAMASPVEAEAATAHESIIGGQFASPPSWGFTVAIYTQRGLCSGVVISPTRILTAAHCVLDLPGATIRANSPYAFSGGETFSAATAFVVPSYDGQHNDLGVLALSARTTAPPITLASAADDAAYSPVGNTLSIAGFGDRNPGGKGKSKIGVLTAATVLSVPGCGRFVALATEVCDQGGRVTTAFSGRKRRAVVRDTCFGDSGGPLVVNTAAGPRLLGILSRGESQRRGGFSFVRCGLAGFPSIHTRVAPYLDFIQSHL
jgi:secreted trypsin-like serine protease